MPARLWILPVSALFFMLMPALVLGQHVPMVSLDTLIVGQPGDTLEVPVRLDAREALAGIQVNVDVADTSGASLAGWIWPGTAVGLLIDQGALKVIGPRGLAVASPTAYVPDREVLVIMRVALRKPGKTPMRVRVSLAVGDNPPRSRSYRLPATVVVTTASRR